jgi:hypothetical protein
MASNLRSKPIQGYVTDSAGNILRNAQIVIKSQNPLGTVIVDSIKTDDNGYYISNPIPDGIYDVYESGIRVARISHVSDKSKIQCYKPSKENYPFRDVPIFSSLVTARTLNDFKFYIQIEPDFVDTFQLGNSFPLYDYDMSNMVDDGNDISNIAKFFSLSTDSRITTTRFDVEYYSPITSVNTQYKRIRWSGVPGIRFYKNSKIVVPIDYYSITPSLPKFYIAASQVSGITFGSSSTSDIVDLSVVGNSFCVESMIPKTSIGDIIKIEMVGGVVWYGIVLSASDQSIALERWRSSRYLSTTDLTGAISKVFLYDGIFQNISDINDTNNERFTVVENIYAQDDSSELYNYSYQYELS